MNPDGSGQPLIKIPIGFQQRLPFAFASGISNIMHESKSAGKIGMDVIDSALDAFNPIGGSQLSTTFVPSVAKPAIELYANKNWLGNPIKPTQMPWDIRPESQMAFSGVSIPSKIAAEKLNKATGGDEMTPGAIDISPEAIDHVGQFFTGTLGKDIYKVMDIGMRYFDDMRPVSDLKVKDVPIIGRFTGANTEYYTTSKFHEISTEANRAYKKAELWAEKGDPRINKYLDDNLALISLGKDVGSIQKEISSITSDIRKVKEAAGLDAKDRLEIINDLNLAKEGLMNKFIKAHRTIKQKGERPWPTNPSP